MHMKLTKIINLLVLGSALTITAFGCKTKPLHPTPLPGSQPPIGDVGPGRMQPIAPGTGDTGVSEGRNTGIPPVGQGAHAGWIEERTALQAQTVYFEYDKSSIKKSEQPKLEDVANYLKSNANAAVRVEGNCDERGTEEYNRSLGDRRALGAREYLVRLGIDASRVETISYGEDKPADASHNEAAWSKNRRDEFVVLTPPKM
jgi:peptidoglycan-associated lipoprotein